VVKEDRIINNDTTIATKLPHYYLAQLSCDQVNEVEHWTRKDKHICSNKNYMCLTVSSNLKDGGVFVNLMAYEASAKSQQWTTSASNSRTAVALVNVGTSLCLFLPLFGNNKTMKASTAVKRCPQPNWFSEFLFYFEQANFKDRPNCPPL